MKKLASLLTLTALFVFTSAQAEEVKEKFNNLTVNANLVMAPDQDFSGNVVLLTHGTTTHNGRETYRNIQKLLAENGISSLAPNLSLNVNDRHGEVDCSLPQTHHHEDAMKEIGFWLNWLKAKGATQVILMGHSRGGNQTAWFSVEHQDPVIQKVVLIAPATWDYASELEDYQKRYNRDPKVILQKAEALVKEGKGDTLMEHTDLLYCKDTKVSASAFVSYYKDEPRMDTPTLLKRAHYPTLVIVGTADDVVSDLAEKMQSVDNELVKFDTVEDADHFFLDFYAEDLVSKSVEFIQE
ncbi:alpha/beta hydrolase [Thiomicrorhabdus heinhorstiae]|uniref:Alpha/beta hydrolase n=1 Tax=Thiomicrorhabdus heinhorstiae TaxID=2748010 RepID=A0ABS0C177_9GAMM|nr:alpha/beta hydrolase [Thiomicrorhabdus heinhorstiae]MBF6058836.1 alpha/beta hydrolase [Thiomicrorhabdus heinhorstiae]